MNADTKNELAMKKWLHLPVIVNSHLDADSHLFDLPVELKSSQGKGVQIGRDISFKFYRKYIDSILVVSVFRGNRIVESIYLPPSGRRDLLRPLYAKLMLRSRIVNTIGHAKPIILPLLYGKVSSGDFDHALDDIRRVRQYRVAVSSVRTNGIVVTSSHHFRKLVRGHE